MSDLDYANLYLSKVCHYKSDFHIPLRKGEMSVHILKIWDWNVYQASWIWYVKKTKDAHTNIVAVIKFHKLLPL